MHVVEKAPNTPTGTPTSLQGSIHWRFEIPFLSVGRGLSNSGHNIFGENVHLPDQGSIHNVVAGGTHLKMGHGHVLPLRSPFHALMTFP